VQEAVWMRTVAWRRVVMAAAWLALAQRAAALGAPDLDPALMQQRVCKLITPDELRELHVPLKPAMTAFGKFPGAEYGTTAVIAAGWNTQEVEVNHELNPQCNFSPNANYVKRWVSISACGQFLRYRRSTTTQSIANAK
jgi:hypothetical protein